MAEKEYKLIDERYLILKKLGNGKLCEVFEVLDLKEERIFAGKKYTLTTYMGLSDKFKETVFTEINILQQVDNPYILKCWDVVFTDTDFYLMLTYCGHGSLEDHIANIENKKLGEQQAIRFLKQIIEGYKGLHSLGIVHGDIKSENIFMKSPDHVLLGDLNTSKSNLKAASIVGTELYSPPLKTGWAGNNYQHDVWSIGVVFFEMVFGIEDWYTNFMDKTFGDNLVYPKAKDLSNESKFLLFKFLNPNKGQMLTVNQMLEEIKFIETPNTGRLDFEFSMLLASQFKDFERRIGVDSDSEELLSFNAEDSFTKSGSEQGFIESEYEFDSSEVTGNQDSQKPNLSNLLYEGSKADAKKREIMGKLDEKQKIVLKKPAGHKHAIFLKSVLVYLDMTQRLETFYHASNNNKTLLYLLTLLVNRTLNWLNCVLIPLKKGNRYFSTGKKY